MTVAKVNILVPATKGKELTDNTSAHHGEEGCTDSLVGDDFHRMQVAGFVRGVLFSSQSGDFITRSELELLVLEEIGLHVSEELLVEISAECDKDGDGKIDPKELEDFINNIRPSTRGQRVFFLAKRILSSLFFWASCVFLAALIMGVITNAASRRGKIIVEWGEVHLGHVIVWLFTLGCYIFWSFSYERHKSIYELNQRAKQVLLKWVKQSHLFGPVEKMSFVVKRNPQRIRHVFHPSVHYPHGSGLIIKKFVGGEGMSFRDLKSVLELSSIFVPSDVLSNVFNEIDLNRNGTLSLSEIRDFLEKHQANKGESRCKKYADIMKSCSRAWDFWANLVWVVGSFACLGAIYTSNVNVAHKLGAVGAVSYFLGGAFLVPVSIQEVYKCVDYSLELADAIHFLALPRFSAEEVHRRSNAICSSQRVTSFLGHARHRYNILAASSLGMDAHVHVERNLCDKSLSFVQLYDALLENGVVLPFDVCLQMFRRADANKDGHLQIEEFIEYIKRNKRNECVTKRERHCQAMRMLPRSIQCWTAILYFLAGLFLLFATFIDLEPRAVLNHTLTMNLMYLTNTVYYILKFLATEYLHYGYLETNKIKFRNGIIDQSKQAAAMEAGHIHGPKRIGCQNEAA